MVFSYTLVYERIQINKRFHLNQCLSNKSTRTASPLSDYFLYRSISTGQTWASHLRPDNKEMTRFYRKKHFLDHRPALQRPTCNRQKWDHQTLLCSSLQSIYKEEIMVLFVFLLCITIWALIKGRRGRGMIGCTREVRCHLKVGKGQSYCEVLRGAWKGNLDCLRIRRRTCSLESERRYQQ